jgi:AraC-like DNA-binding protein
MDVLTDILNSAGLRKSLLARHALHQPWAMHFPCDKSMGFHILTHGEAYVRAPQFESPLKLERGDIILMNRGFDHDVTTHMNVDAPAGHAAGPFPGPEISGQNPLAVIVCGLYQFQTPPIHPLFAELPDMIIVRAGEIPSHSPLYIAQQLLSAELAQAGQGSESVVKALVDVMFHYILRNWMDRQSAENGARDGVDRSRWSLAMKDVHLQKAIQAVHGDPSADWTLEGLASIAGLSRAAFAQRFKRVAGDTPAHYVARVRVQRAMDMLRGGDDSVERIAEVVGYGDPFVFSKAFKRIQGVSPREFRGMARAA